MQSIECVDGKNKQKHYYTNKSIHNSKIYIYPHIHRHIHIHTYMYIWRVCVCVCVYIYIHVSIYIYIHAFARPYTQVHARLERFKHALSDTYTHMHTHTHTRTHVHSDRRDLAAPRVPSKWVCPCCRVLQFVVVHCSVWYGASCRVAVCPRIRVFLLCV